jgi:hypothetical protein
MSKILFTIVFCSVALLAFVSGYLMAYYNVESGIIDRINVQLKGMNAGFCKLDQQMVYATPFGLNFTQTNLSISGGLR